jgi:hypothetical protein
MVSRATYTAYLAFAAFVALFSTQRALSLMQCHCPASRREISDCDQRVRVFPYEKAAGEESYGLLLRHSLAGGSCQKQTSRAEPGKVSQKSRMAVWDIPPTFAPQGSCGRTPPVHASIHQALSPQELSRMAGTGKTGSSRSVSSADACHNVANSLSIVYLFSI